MASPNPANPLAQTQNNIPNLNPSPFQPQSGQSSSTQKGQNPQSPMTGQNAPNYGSGGLSQLIQTNNSLIQAIQKLTQNLGGTGGAGGNAAPSHNRQFSQGPNTFGGLPSGMGLGGMFGQMATNKIGSYMSPGTRTFAQAGMNTLSGAINAGLNGVGTATNIGASISGASSAQGLFSSLSGVPLIGGFLASLGTGFGIAQGRFGEMSQYEKTATMASLQLGREGRNRLDLGAGGLSNIRGMNAMTNEFRSLGIGPTEGASLLSQMMMSTGALNAGAHLETQDPLNPSRNLTLAQMMRQGYSAGTVGFAQKLTPNIFGNQLMGTGKGISAAQIALGIGRTMNFNDVMQNEFNQQTYGLINKFALSGASSLNNIDLLSGGIGGIKATGVGNDIAMQALMQRENKAQNLGQIESPFVGLANNRLRFKFLQQAGFDQLKAQELQQSATSYDKFKMIADDVGVRQAQLELQGAGFNAMELKSFAAQYSGAKAEITGLETYKTPMAGNETAQLNAAFESDTVQNRRDLVMKVAKLNREIENTQIDFLGKNFDTLSGTVTQLNAMQLTLLDSTAALVTEFTNLATQIKEKGVVQTLKDIATPSIFQSTPKTASQIQQDKERTKQMNNAYDADPPVGGP